MRSRVWPTMRPLKGGWFAKLTKPAQGHTHAAKRGHRHLRKTQELKQDSTGGCRKKSSSCRCRRDSVSAGWRALDIPECSNVVHEALHMHKLSVQLGRWSSVEV